MPKPDPKPQGELGPEELFGLFSSLIERENFFDISLTIYYFASPIELRPSQSVDQLMMHHFASKVVLSGQIIQDKINSFRQINETDIVVVNTSDYVVQAMVYYVFESTKDGKLFDVVWCGWSSDGKGGWKFCVFINGTAVKENRVFIDVIEPFLPVEGRIL